MRNISMKKYWAIASLSLTSYLGFAAVTPHLNAQEAIDSESGTPLVELCNALVAEDPNIESLQCLLEQSTHLNRAKNLARQRG